MSMRYGKKQVIIGEERLMYHTALSLKKSAGVCA